MLSRHQGQAEAIYRRAVTSLIARDGKDQEKLLSSLITLALGVLTVPTIEKLQEEGMFTYEEIEQQMREAPITGKLMRQAEERGLEQGREQGREQGLEAAYAGMLEARFGPHERIAAISQRLATLPRSQASRAVMAAASIEDLVVD